MSNPEDDWSWFWSRVDRSGGPDACWPWLGGEAKANGTGYVQVTSISVHHLRSLGFTAKRRVSAPRVSMAIAGKGQGDAVVRECRNMSCVNPRHLSNKSRGEAALMARSGIGWMLGEEHPNSKLTERGVREIRRRIARGESRDAVASALAIPKARVRSALTRWEHVK